MNIHKTICPECSHDITLYANFCRSCGTSFKKSYRSKTTFFKKRIRKQGEYDASKKIRNITKLIFWFLGIAGSLFLIYTALVSSGTEFYLYTH